MVLKIAPKQGQPEEKTMKGVKYKWCGICGFWSKTHGTSEHQAKGKMTMAKHNNNPIYHIQLGYDNETISKAVGQLYRKCTSGMDKTKFLRVVRFYLT